jgi:hypothetical protein
LIDFPINPGNIWGLPGVSITIDGTVESFYFRLANIVNKILRLLGIDFLPPEIADLLPVIDLSDLMEAFEIYNHIEIDEIPPEINRRPLFESSAKQPITVAAGTYDAYNILIVEGVGNMYYSPDVGMLVKATGNFNEIIPVMQSISMELIKIE